LPQAVHLDPERHTACRIALVGFREQKPTAHSPIGLYKAS